MSVYKTEEEQVEDLKRWTKTYGPSILTGIILALVIMYGWKYWKSYQTNRDIAASTLYQSVLVANETKDNDKASADAHKLMTTYPKSPYSSLASMTLAKVAVEKQQYEKAITDLEWVTTHSSNQDLTAIANLRIARIQINQQHANDALKTLSNIKNPAFTGLAQSMMGDAYAANHDYQKAKAAYQQAIKLIPNANDVMPMLQIKLENLPLSQNNASEA